MSIDKAIIDRFIAILEEQTARAEKIKAQGDFTDYGSLQTITIGVIGGDGIGPSITGQAHRVLKYLLDSEEKKGRIAFKVIEGLTLENRVAENRGIPVKVLAEIKECDVVLKGPTTTPQAGGPIPNIESANVSMRKELDLFANVRPVKVPSKGIDWTFFRENTEGSYAVGNKGFDINDDVSIDFTITTTAGTERICRAAFDYAKANGKTRVTAVTKANIIKATDGKFLKIFHKIAREYDNIIADDWYIDIMTAKLIDEKRRGEFQVLVLPNLYGDILTDEAAEIQGGVGTCGSANIGKKYAMFEAIHGSAPRMVAEGRDIYADPVSVMRASVMLLSHIGYIEESIKLDKALDICALTERKLIITGRDTGATTEQFADYVMETLSGMQ